MWIINKGVNGGVPCYRKDAYPAYVRLGARRDGGPSCGSFHGMIHAADGATNLLVYPTLASVWSSSRQDPTYPGRPLCGASVRENRNQRSNQNHVNNPFLF